MSGEAGPRFGDSGAVLATMHGKERVIAPLLQAMLGLRIHLPADFDTDRFGTFSREHPRADPPLDTALAKIAAAFKQVPHASIGVACEGSFGPHPQIPFLPFDSEIVLLVDRRNGLEIADHHATPRTNFSQAVVNDLVAARPFAGHVGFPAHGVIVIGTVADKRAPDLLLRKHIETESALFAAVREAIEMSGSAHIETDMRALRNPTRMRAIKPATIDLIRCYRSICPQCSRPGFGVTQRLTGLRCAACGVSTDMVYAEILQCAGCAHRSERTVSTAPADPGVCDNCNP
jgi:hypothetical protein